MLRPWPVAVTAGANGVATASLPQQAVGVKWQIGIVSVQTNSGNATKAEILLNGNFVCGTSSGNFDTASNAPPIDADMAKDKVQVVWIGCNAGDQCTAVFFYEDAA